MIRHIFKMVWNRKGANFLIAVEILIAFLVVFAVFAVGAFHFDHYRQPLGFSWQNVWKVDVDFGEDEAPALSTLMETLSLGGAESDALLSVREIFDRLLVETSGLDEIETAAGMSFAPYAGSSWRWGLDTDRGKVTMNLVNATETLDRVMDLELVRGRWFERADDAGHRRKIVINERLASEVFGDQDPVGQVIVDHDEEQDDVEMTVVGVVTDFRYKGELSSSVPFAFMWPRREENAIDFLEAIVVRVKPGTPPEFEEDLLRRLHAVAPLWSFKIQPLAAARENYLRKRLAPLTVAALVAGFLMVMVALGLLGVLWQNVTQRTHELGLRRAKGATVARIRRQVIGELLILTSLALAVGVLVVVQLPITGWFPDASAGVYGQALIVSIAAMALLTSLSALYPSYLATRIEPAEALRDE